VAFYEALAAREEQRFADRLATAARAVAVVARARAESGLNAPVDADVADAAAVRALQEQFAAERRSSRARATLASLWGLDPSQASLSVEGELVPIPELARALASDPAESLSKRPELLVVEGERRALELRADTLRRTRIPNPTVSVFAQRDGFDERVLGLGISFPIPLPGGVGRTNAGEIAEAEALARGATVDRERIEREIRLEVANARQAFASREKEVEAYTPERTARAETTLVALGQEVEAGRLSVRDAIIAQQSLIELLRANVEVRWAWCLAAVDLARALGFPLEGKAP
jgi:cobalt-zinc-cadmium efflux system outer membrane protein